MGVKTGIAWCDATWNPWVGCTKVSEGCANCYMFREQQRYGKDPTTLRRTSERKWKEVQSKKLVPPGSFVFVCSWSDFFHEDVHPVEQNAALAIMAIRSDLTFLLLTKRPTQMARSLDAVTRQGSPNNLGRLQADLGWVCSDFREVVGSDIVTDYQLEAVMDAEWPLQNVWLGVTAENQEQWEERGMALCEIAWPGKKLISVEPMLGAIDDTEEGTLHGVDWVICGGESGPGHREINLDWARGLRDQCVAAGVPFFLKQYSANKPEHMPMLDGKVWAERPERSE